MYDLYFFNSHIHHLMAKKEEPAEAKKEEPAEAKKAPEKVPERVLLWK